MPARRPEPLIRPVPLPGLLGRIERLIGSARAERFAILFGGQELYIPRSPGPEHPIARAIGHKAARLLGQQLGGQGNRDGGTWSVPVGETELKWNVSRRLALQGWTRNEIVRHLRRRYGLTASIRSVQEAIRDLPPEMRVRRGRAPIRARQPAPPPHRPAPPLPLFEGL